VKLRCAAALVLAALAGAGAVQAQSVTFQAGRLFESTELSSYRLAWARAPRGIFGTDYHASLIRTAGRSGPGFAGFGADLSLFRGGQGPYGTGGIDVGLARLTSGSGYSSPAFSWTAGAGYELTPLPFLSLLAEGRWREIPKLDQRGVELALGLGIHLGGGRTGGARPLPPDSAHAPRRLKLEEPDDEKAPPAERTSPRDLPLATRGELAVPADAALSASALRLAIVGTASDAMGKRYQLGGTGKGEDGFDCSGLIQHAYARHGIALPRRSVDQAREGRAVERKLESLRPGDILTFANRGRTVSHVGLYLGGGRFIHSASKGVQESLLSADDPYGKWWFKRWVGVRRIVS
jgi:cell wall-associated NlpC family hydrolase